MPEEPVDLIPTAAQSEVPAAQRSPIDGWNEDRRVSFDVTPAARRKVWLRIARNTIVAAGAVSAFFFVVSGRLTASVLPYVVGVAGATLIAGARQRGSRGLELTPDGVTSRATLFTLSAHWSDIDSLVRLAPRPAALALHIARPASVTEKRLPLGAPWRRQPYPFDRTIPLEQFLDGDLEESVIRRLREVKPSLFASEPALLPRQPVRLGWRALGLIAGLAPFALVGGIVIAVLAPPPFDAFTARLIAAQAVFLAGALSVSLWRWHAPTGERTMDYVGRGLAAPRTGERRSDVVRPLAYIYAIFVVAVAVGFGLGRLNASTTGDLVATYGQAHACYFDTSHKLSGCRLNDGTIRGRVTTTLVTCYFNEPLPVSATTFHCRE
jgi:hypothetical protein